MKREAWVLPAAAGAGLLLVGGVFCVAAVLKAIAWVWPFLPDWARRFADTRAFLYLIAVVAGLCWAQLSALAWRPLLRVLGVPDDVFEPKMRAIDYPFKKPPRNPGEP